MEVILLRITLIVLNLMIMGLSSISQGGHSSKCSNGFYYNSTDHEDGNNSCIPCTQCPAGSEILKGCTNQSDAVCRPCDPGTFSGGRFKCKNCSHCPPGTYVAEYCRVTSDTRCEPCAKGMYSSEWSMRRCSRCSRCSKLLTTLKNCTNTENYKCGDCIEGYYKHPNLPMCIRCAYCYPDNPGATFLVPDCITKSADPNMRCMPIAGVPQLAGYAGSDDSNKLMTTSMSTAAIHVSVMFSSSRTPREGSALIPPNISIPIIAICVSITILVIVVIIMYKFRKRSRKSKLAFSIFTTSTFIRKTKTSDANDGKRHSDSSNEIVMVHGEGSIMNNTETSGHNSPAGCEQREQTTFAQTHKEAPNVPIPFACELKNSDVSAINVDNNQSLVSDGEKIPVASLEIIIGPSNIQNQFIVSERTPSKGPDVEKDSSSVSVVVGTPYCAENEAFEDDEDESSLGAILPKESTTSGNAVTRKTVKTEAALQHLSATNELTEDVDGVSQPSGRLPKRPKAEAGEMNVKSHISNPVPLKPLLISALASGRNDVGSGTDSEDSSPSSSRSAMSSDYDSDAVVNNTLLDRDQAPATSAGPRRGAPGGQAKKKRSKHRRKSDQGMFGHTDSAKQLYSKIGTFSV